MSSSSFSAPFPVFFVILFCCPFLSFSCFFVILFCCPFLSFFFSCSFLLSCLFFVLFFFPYAFCMRFPFPFVHHSPKQGGHAEGFLRSGLGPGGHLRWYPACPANLVTLTAQKFPHLPFSKEVSHETVAGGPLFFRRARFTSAPCSFFEYRQAWHFRDILRSETSFFVTGVGHRTLFHPRGRRGTFCTLLKRCQAWVNQRRFWQAQYLVNLHDVLKGSKSRFVKLSSNLIWDMMMIPCGRTSDTSGLFFVAGAVLCRLRQKSVLAQPSRHFARIGSLSLWRGANFELRSPAQPSRHFGPGRLHSLWRSVNIDGQGDLDRELARRSCTETLPRPRGLLQRSCQKSSYRELVRRSLQESCQETSYRDLVQRSCQGTSFKAILYRHCIEHHRDLLRSC